MPHEITLTLQIGQIRHEATLNLPASFIAPDIIEQEEDALILLAILQYTARNTLHQLDKDLTTIEPSGINANNTKAIPNRQ